MHGLVCKQIWNPSRIFIQCQTRHQSELYPYHTRQAKALPPGHIIHWKHKFGNRERRQRSHLSGETTAKTPELSVIWRRNSTKCEAGSGLIEEHQTHSSRQIGRFFLDNKDFMDEMRCDGQPVGCTTEDPFENWVLLNRVRGMRMPTEFCALHIANKHLASSTFLHAAMIPACHGAYVFLTEKNFQTLQSNNGIALHSTLSEISFPSRRAAACQWKLLPVQVLAPSYFFYLEESGDHTQRFCGFARLGRCILSFNRGLFATQGSKNVPTESYYDLYCFIQSSISCEASLRAKGIWILWNHFVINCVACLNSRQRHLNGPSDRKPSLQMGQISFSHLHKTMGDLEETWKQH